jgi:type II secretory pathway pseudopilin PulG
MMTRQPIRRRPSEDGYMMIAVMFMLAVLIIAMAVAAPKVKEDIQREREVETMQRGKQYIRAIQLYYRKFHAYPPNVDALVKTQEIRFLRKKYIDPTTGKDEWKPIQFGQNKAPTAMGFFGQPLGGSSIAGIGPGGGNGLNGATGINGQPAGSSAFGSGTFGSNSSGSSSFGSNSSGSSSFGSNGIGANAGGANGTPGTSTDGSSSSDPNGTGSAGAGPGTGIPGQTFGGAGIIGFSPGSPKQSILVYKKKTHYNEWEFVYDPLMEQMTMGSGGAGLGGQPISGSSTPIGGSPGFGSSPGSPGFGSNPSQPGFGTPPSPTPTPAPQPAPPPQQ